MSIAVRDAKDPPSSTAKSVELTFSDCNNRLMHQALEKLDDFTAWSNTDTMWRFTKIKAAFDRQSKTVRRGFQKLIRRHAIHEIVTTKGTDGNPKPVLDKLGKPKREPKMVRKGHTMDYIFKDQAAFDIDYANLMRTTFTIKAYQLPLDDLIKAGLSPKELRAVARIADNIDPELIEEPQVADDDDEIADDHEEPTQPSAVPTDV